MARKTCLKCDRKMAPLISVTAAAKSREKLRRMRENQARGLSIVSLRDLEAFNQKNCFPDNRAGYAGNGIFCTIRCGYEWAVRHARRCRK